MNIQTRLASTISLFLSISASGQIGSPLDAGAPEVNQFQLRDGYRVSAAIMDVEGARFLEIDDQGTLYVSRPRLGEIRAFADKNGDGEYESASVFVSDKQDVHGLCWHKGWLWFTTAGAVYKARDTDADGKADEVIAVLPDGSIVKGELHWWRSILVTDSGFYTSVGDNANFSEQAADSERCKIFRFSLDGADKKVFCSGIRNTEKLRIRPGSEEVWGIDHGSDSFGAKYGEKPGMQPITDLNPPDELNRYFEGGFYGHPYLTGFRVPRPEFADKPDLLELAAKTVPPEWGFGAHWAANSFCFIDPTVNQKARHPMPKDHEGGMFVACRGSWNSSVPVGYCVARVLFEGGRPYGLLKVVETKDTDSAFARPVDCVQAPDGSVLFSSDATGRVYRITWVGVEPSAPTTPAPTTTPLPSKSTETKP